MNLETKITIYKFTPQLFTLTPSNATQPNTTKVNKKKQYVYLSIEAIYELPSLN